MKGTSSAPALRGQGQVVQHQAPEEDAEEADVKGRQQESGLQGVEPQVQGHARQVQADQVGQPFPLPGHQVGIDGPLDFHQMALEVHGKTGKELQAPGLREARC